MKTYAELLSLADLSQESRLAIYRRLVRVGRAGLAASKITQRLGIPASRLQYPILINRPFIVTPIGTRLCRLSETGLQILPIAQLKKLCAENGEVVAERASSRDSTA